MENPRILYIDDEVDLLDLAASFFEDESLPIETCSDFQEALGLIRQNPYDLIILDAKMPSGSGHELMSIVRREGIFKGKTILVTGNIERGGREEDRGYDLIIYKPIHFQDLIENVKKILE